MADNIAIFQENFPSAESYWRSVILFGRNVASYKFALAKSLLEIAPTGQTVVTLEELSVPFSRYLCEHLKAAEKQGTNGSSSFLDACRQFNEGALSHQALIYTTKKLGFSNVIDAFHIVNNEELPVRFYTKDYTKSSKKIILTDELFRLQETSHFGNFTQEAESRWNLVQTAWELGVSRNLLSVQYDAKDDLLFVEGDKLRRKDVTSARDALNGYQKGKCFYCFDDISVVTGSDDFCDVDHFFPHALQTAMPEVNLNGVWNLVLACNHCNRGVDGKFAKVPAMRYIERLHRRNEFLISSHHPLRETLMNQTGRTTADRIHFLKQVDEVAINLLIHRWDVDLVGEEIF